MSENPYFSNEEAVRRGSEAQRMLESEVLGDALAAAKRRFVADWLANSNVDVQRACWAKIHALDEVTKALNGIVSDGHVAQASIDHANR